MGKHLLLLLLCFIGHNILFAKVSKLDFNDPPIVTISDPGITIYQIGSGSVKVDPQLTVTDADSQNAIKAEVILTNRLDGAFTEGLALSQAGLNLIEEYGLTLNIEPIPNMVITITGVARMSVYQQILREILYKNDDPDATPGDRLANYTVTDENSNTSKVKVRIIRIEMLPLEIEAVTVNVPESGFFGIGDEIRITVKYSEVVFVSNGPPYILINIGGKQVKAFLVSGSGTDELVFSHVVQEGELDLDGAEVAGEISLDGAAIQDRNERDAPLELELEQTILVNGIRPFVSTINPPADGTYGICSEDEWVFELEMSEDVTVDVSLGNPTLQLIFNSGTVQAVFDAEASSASKLIFRYQIQEVDIDPDGIVIDKLILNGALIRDIAGNNLVDVDFELSTMPNTESIIIDTTPPNAPVITGISEDTGVSDQDGITNDQNLVIAGSAIENSTVEVFLNGESIGTTTSNDAGLWSLDYSAVTLAEGNYNLTAIAINEVCLESEPSAPFPILIDITPPIVQVEDIKVSLPSSGTVTVSPRSADTGSSDNFTSGDDLIYTLSKSDFTCEDVGENEVEVTVTDLSGNSSVATITITVIDDLAPVLLVENMTLFLGEDGTVNFTVEDLDTVVSDNCGIDEFSIDKSAFSCADEGEQTVTLMVSDKSGNSSEFTFTVTVVDNLNPVIERTPDDILAGTNDAGEYTVPDFIADLNISDNCGLESVVQFPAAGSTLTGFDTPHTITITATDIYGNETIITFTVTLLDRAIAEIIPPDIITVPWNTPIGSVSLPVNVTVILKNGEEVVLTVLWLIENYNPLEPGIYQEGGTLQLPANVFNPDGLQPTINILVEDKPLPLDIELDNNVFDMNSSSNSPIGNFSTIDPSDDVHNYAFSGDSPDNDLFRIVDGVLYWNSTEFHPGRTEFTITVSSTDRMGNVIIQTFTIQRTLTPLSDLRLPNVFSPNNDGVNDTWGAEILGFYGKIRIMIYERSGKRVYYSIDATERWDGKYLGKEVIAGTYYSIIEVESTGEVHRSALTILRD